ncbi:hypothetical protein DY000_02037775 [Brassica cretica]|uniref:Uncharacterized protein n=1 Tax=Brassica cretica TaxID=69181 RepID=A0ABQ7BLR1_BRACR|nr:hypothetical protein DY000_02037775 [Brassica cretica]
MVRGDAPVRSSDLRTSVSWLKDKVKGIRKLRLNQDEVKGNLRELVGDELNSARWSVMVRAGVVGPWAVMDWWDLDMNHQGSVGLGLRQGTQDDVLGLIFGQPKGEKDRQLGLSFSINKESLAQKMARNSLGKALPKSYQKDKERETGGCERRTVWSGVILLACSDRGKTRP